MCYLHDVALARQINTVVSIAALKKMAPDEIASDMNNFEAYWLHQTQRLEDVCRQNGIAAKFVFHGGASRVDLPNALWHAAGCSGGRHPE